MLEEARQSYLDRVADLIKAVGIAVTTKDYRQTFPPHIRKLYFGKRGVRLAYLEDCLYAAGDAVEHPIFQINGQVPTLDIHLPSSKDVVCRVCRLPPLAVPDS